MSVRMAIAKLSVAAAGGAIIGGGAVHVAEPQTSVVRYKSGEDDASGELIDVKTQGGSSSSSSSGGGYGERYVPERGHERAQRRVRRTIERTEDCCAEEQYAEAPIALPPLPSAPSSCVSCQTTSPQSSWPRCSKLPPSCPP